MAGMTLPDFWLLGANRQPAGATGPNPFQRGADGRIVSLSAIGAATKADPRRARELCKAAGEDVRRWFPENPR